ncbi:MAG: SMP-30/gluconolactonase/LRE family protein [Clostridiales Family XIII bacterium]|jgi:sugar lactone lactonase YvrE|nr:SMP-30/gluconolactonase/LRE family protein [Clostridiales Family XIII bacterium]
MQTPKLFTLLPDYICTPDGMEIDKEGNLILSCPNYADLSMPSCIVKIDKARNVKKWFDIPLHEKTNEARSMGIAFGPDGDLYIVDNQGWTGLEELQYQGRILRVRMNGDEIEKVTVVAHGMEHPNGIRIRGNHMYVTQSMLSKVKTPDGKLMSCVYRFRLDDENIQITNTLDDENILTTYITHNPLCQYGMDGIVFDQQGFLYVGNFGDATVFRITFDEAGNVTENLPWACNAQELKSTDGMTIDEYGNIYIADFSANAIVKVDAQGNVKRIAQSPDTDGINGELDEPGEPCVWNGQIVVSCFDLVTDDQKVNTAHEMPATMSLLEIEP